MTPTRATGPRCRRGLTRRSPLRRGAGPGGRVAALGGLAAWRASGGGRWGGAGGVWGRGSDSRAADNGYKLCVSDGAQVIPPADAQIERRIAGLGPLSQVPVAAAGSPLITRHGVEVARAYLDAVVATAAGTDAAPGGLGGVVPPGTSRAPGRGGPNDVYTPMHGVAGRLMLRALEQAGFAAPHGVAAQAEPDPDFPTVAFPNPEEPGALDLALADARRFGADLVVASDPDGDRLARALPRPEY